MRHLILSSLALVAMTSFAMAGTNQPATVQHGPTVLSASATELTDLQLDRVAAGDLGLSFTVSGNLLNAAINSSGNSLNNLHSLQSEGNGVVGAVTPFIGVISNNPGTGQP